MNLDEIQEFLNKMSQEKNEKSFLPEDKIQELFKIVENLESLLEKEIQTIENQPEDKE